jgi:hypothetical protein
MTLLFALLCSALAATPGGFRMSTARPIDAAGARLVTILDPGDELIVQTTPRFSKVWNKYGLEAEIAGLIHTGSGGYVFPGLGSFRSGHWYVRERANGTHHRFGIELALPVTPRHLRPTAWGSSAQDTVVTTLVQIGWLLSWNEDAPWEIRTMLGVGHFPHSFWTVQPIIDIGVAKVQPLSDTVSLVFEQDFIYFDYSPANFRPMVRFDIGKSAVDAGFQVPWGSWLAEGHQPSSVQVIAQYRGMF